MLQRLFNELFKKPEPPRVLTEEDKVAIAARNAAHLEIFEKFLATVGDVMPDMTSYIDIGPQKAVYSDNIVGEGLSATFGPLDLAAVPVTDIKSENDFILLLGLGQEEPDNESPWICHSRSYRPVASLEEALRSTCASMGERLFLNNLEKARLVDAVALQCLAAAGILPVEFKGAGELVERRQRDEALRQQIGQHAKPIADFLHDLGGYYDWNAHIERTMRERQSELHTASLQGGFAIRDPNQPRRHNANRAEASFKISYDLTDGAYATISCTSDAYGRINHASKEKVDSAAGAVRMIGDFLVNFHTAQGEPIIAERLSKVVTEHLAHAKNWDKTHTRGAAPAAPATQTL